VGKEGRRWVGGGERRIFNFKAGNTINEKKKNKIKLFVERNRKDKEHH